MSSFHFPCKNLFSVLKCCLMDDECLTTLVPSPSLEICNSPIPNTASRASDEPEGRKKRCWFLTPYLHWREEAPYWKRHCSSASYTCPGATVGYRKSRFRGSLSRHVPRPELSKKQTYNSIVSCNKETFLHLQDQQG